MAGEKMHNAYERAREETEKVAERAREQVVKRPLTIVLGSFAVGMILGSLLLRRRR